MNLYTRFFLWYAGANGYGSLKTGITTANKKLKNYKFFLNSGLALRGFFSDHCVEDWSFEKYCQYSQKANSADQKTLLTWFKDDLSWLSTQELPRGLKSFIITLKKKDFSKTCYAEEVSAQISDSNAQRETTVEQDAIDTGIVENVYSEPNKQSKRKVININDALDELEDQIIEYERQPIHSEEKLDMKKEILGVKKDILDKSLSNIIVVTRMEQQLNSRTSHINTEANKVRHNFFRDNISDIKFNDDAHKSLKIILDYNIYFQKYLPEEFDVSNAQWEEIDLDCRIDLLQLAKKATIYDRVAIEAISNFLTYSSNHDIKLSSESHLESSFIHPIIHPIFKSSTSVPHSSNKSITKQKESDPRRRPDYVSDCRYSGEFDFTLMFGELKVSIWYVTSSTVARQHPRSFACHLSRILRV
ncbi:hypothetical protein EDC94DRAFT_590688 [Helicostylum pulchrum]|nr:hypothetical protein EDC94DRAFT_590688 [Helicostylum pulchrum]